MRHLTSAWLVAVTFVVAATPVPGQGHAAPPATTGPSIAPAKPIVVPRIGRGKTAATAAGTPNPKVARVSVSARQAAEQTIAALVEAMKNMPKRPPAPPEPRTRSARRPAAASGADAAVADGPPPITHRVTWPSNPDEAAVTRRVELAWPGTAANGVSLRWNEPAP